MANQVCLQQIITLGLIGVYSYDAIAVVGIFEAIWLYSDPYACLNTIANIYEYAIGRNSALSDSAISQTNDDPENLDLTQELTEDMPTTHIDL